MADLRQSLIDTLHEKDRVMSRPLTKDDYVDAFVDWLFERAEEFEHEGNETSAGEIADLAHALDRMALGSSEDAAKGNDLD
jgi:hypothetical protein